MAVRTLSATPILSIVAILSIASGIGANTAIFRLIDAVMWRMLPVKNPETLMAVVRTSGQAVQEANQVSFGKDIANPIYYTML